MDRLFAQLSLEEVHRDLVRNIVSPRISQDLFDDLTDDPDGWRLAQQVELDTKPPTYRSANPAIHRPFEEAQWLSAIDFPFRHWQASRFSDGSFGVWYGGDSIETTVYETAYHWFHGFLGDAGFETSSVVGERQLYAVRCDAALLDFRPLCTQQAELVHPGDYALTRAVGARIHREGHPGLVNRSARHPPGSVYALLNPGVLSQPRIQSPLTYRLEDGTVTVERRPGTAWLKITFGG